MFICHILKNFFQVFVEKQSSIFIIIFLLNIFYNYYQILSRYIRIFGSACVICLPIMSFTVWSYAIDCVWLLFQDTSTKCCKLLLKFKESVTDVSELEKSSYTRKSNEIKLNKFSQKLLVDHSELNILFKSRLIRVLSQDRNREEILGIPL